MSVLNYILSGSKFKKAKILSTAARLEDGEKADQLFKEAYENFSSVSSSRVGYPDALHNWGLALVNQAQKKSGDEAIRILEQAITKFNLCDAVKSDHLGASLDGGVALMGLAKAKGLNADDDLYVKAKESFLNAENIQQGSASYNLACLYALHNDGDSCLEALEKARNCGLIPDEQDILNDADLDNIKQLVWFREFIESLAVEEEPAKEVKVAVEEAAESDTE
jgi:hypothetical protein